MTLLGDHHLLDHPSHRPEGGDGFTAETAETAEENAQETTESASGSRPPDPPDPPSWLWPHLCGLCDLCGEPRVSIAIAMVCGILMGSTPLSELLLMTPSR